MKCRPGFVSNSSSTSFVLFGAYFDGSDKVLQEAVGDDEAYGYELRELLEELVKDTSLNVWSGYDCEYLYVGKDPSKMGMDETMRQFQDTIKDEMIKIGIKIAEDEKLGFHEECYYDG